MSSIARLHEDVFSYLFEIYKGDPNFRFTIRKSDKESRLSKGYYFYGNDNYLAVSFWSGTNWKNKTPNIIFVIVPAEKKTYIEIAVSDSTIKEKFINEYIVPKVDLFYDNGKLFKHIKGETFLDALGNFINNEKIIIDGIIREHESYFGNVGSENRIGFISEKLFMLRISKVEELRKKKNTKTIIDQPVYLKNLTVKLFSGINDLSFGELPNDTQWIFLTGENGSGKTSILRAITLALYPGITDHLSTGETGHYEINAEVYSGNTVIQHQLTAYNFTEPRKLMTKGFAAYGASRLIINDRNTQQQIPDKEVKKRSTASYSIFHSDGILIDFADEIHDLFERMHVTKVKEKLNIIIETLVECIDPLANIILEGIDEASEKMIPAAFNCLFQEQDYSEKKFEPVTYQQLSSGTKSLIAMIGDMIIRLFRQQPQIYDLAELKGIVLIDEIDIHFHPSQQKNLIQALTDSFPKIQFIVTTHSPIPLLGAPKNSVIFRVRRTVEHGVIVDRIDTLLKFYDLLPNTILTSPIFGLPSIIPDAQENSNEIRTEKNWRQLKFNEAVEHELQEIYKRLSE
jgi:AAA15 family ATPase/GTPase